MNPHRAAPPRPLPPEASWRRRVGALVRLVPMRLRLARARRAALYGNADEAMRLFFQGGAGKLIAAAVVAYPDLSERAELYRDLVCAAVGPGGITRPVFDLQTGRRDWQRARRAAPSREEPQEP